MGINYALIDRTHGRAVDMNKDYWLQHIGDVGCGDELIRDACWRSWSMSVANPEPHIEHRYRPDAEMVQALADWWGAAEVQVVHDGYDWPDIEGEYDGEWFRMTFAGGRWAIESLTPTPPP